ncbi:MAG: ABC transporter ATP-binding protein, partial [Clostridia bacterium]|nr:ABC transporter ATP-binding protein [Clostridia bacterium]
MRWRGHIETCGAARTVNAFKVAVSQGAGALLLQVTDLEVCYGGVVAVSDVSFEVAQGEVVALIGANGAGKSTTLNAISGIVRPRRGRIRFEGSEIQGLPPHRIVALGITQVPEGRRVFPELTVAENLELGAFSRPGKQALRDGLERVYALFPRLAERRRQLAGTLSGGEQQMLALGRALMARPRLMMLD